MSNTKLNQEKSKKPDVYQPKTEYIKAVNMFIQTLAVKRDTNMTRIYSAMQSVKKNEEYC